MSKCSNARRFGLLGASGAGKGTVASMISDYAENHAIHVERVRLADPLYAAQKAVYDAAGLSLPSFYSQDGELLSFLGAHLRKLKPNVLLVRFEETVQRVESQLRTVCQPALIVCDDVRPPDAEFVKSLGFSLVRIVASPESCLRRRHERGDLTVARNGDGFDPAFDDIVCDHTLDNSNSLDSLGRQVLDLLEGR